MSLTTIIAQKIAADSKLKAKEHHITVYDATRLVRLITDSLFDMAVVDTTPVTVKGFGRFSCKTIKYPKDAKRPNMIPKTVESVKVKVSENLADKLKAVTAHAVKFGHDTTESAKAALKEYANATTFSSGLLVDVLVDSGLTKEVSREIINTYYTTLLLEVSTNGKAAIPKLGKFDIVSREGISAISGETKYYSHMALRYKSYDSGKLVTLEDSAG